MNPSERLKQEIYVVRDDQTDRTQMIHNDFIEECARSAHADYLKMMKAAGNRDHPSMVRWADLSEELKESNRNQARSIIEKIDEETTLLSMAQAEHIRYKKEKKDNHYVHAPLKYGIELAQKVAGEKWVELSKNEQKNLSIRLMREDKKNHLLIPWGKLSKADKQKNFDAVEHMVTYLQKKRIAIGFETLESGTKRSIVTASNHHPGRSRSFEKLLIKEFDEQSILKEKLSFRWNTEYASDRNTARKNLDKLNDCLLIGDYEKTIQLFVRKPAADWLNYVFLDASEVDDLMGIIKNSTPECREVVSVAITKELDRLLNFKTLFEHIKNMSQAA